MILNVSVRGVPPDEFADRMSITMTLLLTSVAFKLVTSEWVPKIAYQTLLDYYNLLCIMVRIVHTHRASCNEPAYTHDLSYYMHFCRSL